MLNRPLLGLLVGAALGAFDGLTALLSSPEGSAGIGGSAVEVELQAADLRRTRDTVLGLIADDTGQPFDKIFEDSRHDHWYTAPEARDYGFIDAIAETFGQLLPSRRRPFGLRPTAAAAAVGATAGGAA